MKTQYQMFQESQERLFERNLHFLEMVADPINPLTNQDLIRLIERFPERWSQFSGWIGKLKDEVPNG